RIPCPSHPPRSPGSDWRNPARRSLRKALACRSVLTSFFLPGLIPRKRLPLEEAYHGNGPGGINRRQPRQQARIERGIASGSLTGNEAARLECQRGRIAVREARDRRNGLSRREHAQIERALNRE